MVTQNLNKMDMKDPYKILGLSKGCAEIDIKRAYRSLAKKYHPDHNKDRPDIEEKFKEISAAYAILGDKKQRARYDRGEIDGDGREQAAHTPGGSPFDRSRRQAEDFDLDDAQDIFSDFFRFTGAGKKTSGKKRPFGENINRRAGLDITYEITVAFEEAVNGATRRLHLNDGRDVDIKVPAGIQDGQVIRLAGQGGPGFGGGPSGDAMVQVNVAPHPYFRSEKLDIHLDLPISIDEAVLGGDIEVPTPRGRLTVRVPKGSSTGRRLRLRDKGIRRRDKVGHLYVSLKVMAPKDRDAELEAAIKTWGGQYGSRLRNDAGLA